MKKLFLITFLSLSIALVSCGSNNSNTEENTSLGNNHQTQDTSKGNFKGEKTSKEDCMNGCYIMWKSNPGNKNKTESDMNNNCNDLCNSSEGIQNNDVSACEKSNEPILKDSCFGEVAKNKGDISICEKITEKLLKDSCIMGVANKLKDSSLCDKINEPLMKPACLDEAKEK